MAFVRQHLTNFRNPNVFIKCFALSLILGTLGNSGCSGQAADHSRPKRTLVSGKISYNGSPVDGAVIVFHPDAGRGKSASGVTDESGGYQMSTFETADGVVPGSYRVTVKKLEKQTSNSADDESEAYVPPDESAATPPPKHLLPKRYSKPSDSGFTATVPADGDVTDLDFDLVD